ncbi:unnamed protein product, partial [Staurois parvus]
GLGPSGRAAGAGPPGGATGLGPSGGAAGAGPPGGATGLGPSGGAAGAGPPDGATGLGPSGGAAGAGPPSGHRVNWQDCGNWIRYRIIWINSGHRVTRHQVIWLASGHRVIWQGSGRPWCNVRAPRCYQRCVTDAGKRRLQIC